MDTTESDTRESGREGTADGKVALEIPPALERAWIRQIRQQFDTYNWIFCRTRLKPPNIRIGRGASKLGEWLGNIRTISISAHHIIDAPWEKVMDTLRHEMAHQYVEEVLGLVGAPPHGEAFVKACALLRADPASRSTRKGDAAAAPLKEDKILDRVRELLALARSPNEHEAASAMRMANKYLLEYNLDLEREPPIDRRYVIRYIGRCSARTQEYEYTLSNILRDHFFVSVIWSHSYDALRDRRGKVLQVTGTAENVDMAEYVWHYVTNLAEPLWLAHRESAGAESGTKLQYLAGLLRGFDEKLSRQRSELATERGLVWLGDEALDRFYRHLNPRIRSITGNGVERGSGFHAGMRDGRNLNLHRGVGGGSASRGRELEGPKR